jgi:hypothetical protein
MANALAFGPWLQMSPGRRRRGDWDRRVDEIYHGAHYNTGANSIAGSGGKLKPRFTTYELRTHRIQKGCSRRGITLIMVSILWKNT